MIGKRVIISFNTKNNPNKVSKNALDSIDYACNKWNADRIIITKSLQPHDFHDMFTKLFLPNVIKNYDKCIYLDTDVIINSLSPNPFLLYNDPEKIYVVRDMQQSFLSNDDKNNFKESTLCMPWFDICQKAFQININSNQYKNNFFNAGMFLFSPKNHNYIFSKIQSILKYIPDSYKGIHQVEQALLNYSFMYYLKNKLTYIPKEWNYIDPPLESNKMEGFIYHFTGWHYQEYKRKINSFSQWK